MTIEKQLKAIFNIPDDVQTTPVAMAIEFESLMKRLEIKQKYVKELYDKYLAEADVIESEHANRTISALTGISELGFSDKCTKALSRKGIIKLGDLREITRLALEEDKCIGSDNVDRLDKIIAPLELRYKTTEDYQAVGDDVIDDSALENADKKLNKALNKSDKEVEQEIKERVAQEVEEFKDNFKDSMCADCSYRLASSDCSEEDCIKAESEAPDEIEADVEPSTINTVDTEEELENQKEELDYADAISDMFEEDDNSFIENDLADYVDGDIENSEFYDDDEEKDEEAVSEEDTAVEEKAKAEEDAIFSQVADLIDIDGEEPRSHGNKRYYRITPSYHDPNIPFRQGPIEDYYEDSEEGRRQMEEDKVAAENSELEKSFERFRQAIAKPSESPLLKAMAKIKKEKEKEQATRDLLDGVKTEDKERNERLEREMERLERTYGPGEDFYTGINEEVDVSDDDFDEYSDGDLF